MASLIPAFLAAALLASSAGAQSFSEAKKGASGMASASGRAVDQAVGRVQQGGKYSASALKAAQEWLLQPEPEQKAIAYVNHEGCLLAGGQLKPLTRDEWEKKVKETAAQTEVVYLTSPEMQRVTGQRMAAAVGINKEMRDLYEREMHVKFQAAPGKHVLGLRVGMTDDGKAQLPGPQEKADDSGAGALRLAHELMHIALRQFGNENLGGGGRRSSTDGDVANAHHEFICTLPGWCQFNQGWQPWDGATSQDCADNAQKGQQHNADYLKMMAPKPPAP